MIRQLVERGCRWPTALACVAAMAALLGQFGPGAVSAAASCIFSQVEPVQMSMREFLSAAIRLDPYCAQASECAAHDLEASNGASAWSSAVGFRASPSTFEAWAIADGPHGSSCRITYESGDLNSDQGNQMAIWRGVVEAPLSVISRVIQPDIGGAGEAKLRAAELRVALGEARAAAAAVDMLRKAEILALQYDATGAVQAYGELSLAIGLPSNEIRPVVITGDGPARLVELLERALDADPALLLHEWLTHDPDLMEAEARLGKASSTRSLIDAITLSAGFEWDQSSGGPCWKVGAGLAVGADMVSKYRRPLDAHEHTAMLQRRVDAVKARSTAEFARALCDLQSVWAEACRPNESGDPGAAQIEARRIAEVAAITFLAHLGVFVWEFQ